MLMTRASEYALLSLVTLANATDPMDTETLAHDLGISKSFLAKVLQSLARQGILKSYKGVKGGFVLIQPKEEITILSIMQAAEGKGPTVFDCSPGYFWCNLDDHEAQARQDTQDIGDQCQPGGYPPKGGALQYDGKKGCYATQNKDIPKKGNP